MPTFIRSTVYALILGLLLFVGVKPSVTKAAASDWSQKGASMVPNSSTDFASDSFRQSLANLAKDHANSVSFVIQYYQSNPYSTDIQTGWNTPTDASLASAIDYAHSLGLKVMLKPHLDIYSGEWRAEINPSDRDGWFRNYGAMLSHYAQLGQQHGVEEIAIGTELAHMTMPQFNATNTQNWQNLIAQVRSQFKGQLTYSANWGAPYDEKNQIAFWGFLDFIGVSAYWPLDTGEYNASVQGIENSWSQIDSSDLGPLAQRTGKQIIFTEVGYRSISGAHYEPYSYTRQDSTNEQEQANLYQALFSYWSTRPYTAGFYLWNWETDPNAGWGSNSYTPQHKQAESVMSSWYSNGQSSPPITTGPGSGTAPSLSLSTTTNPASPTPNSSVQIKAHIVNAGGALNDGIIDLEVYNSSNNRALQQYLEHQTIAANSSQDVSFTWNNVPADSYAIKVGVFTSNWSSTVKWEDRAGSMVVQNSVSPVTPTPPVVTPTPPVVQPTPTPDAPVTGGTINVWWPSNGSSVSGTQPFKAVLDGVALARYHMFWQVDGGQLNTMDDSNTDAAHKESLVDVSPWMWRPDGNGYTITFVAQDLNGNTLSRSSVVIRILH